MTVRKATARAFRRLTGLKARPPSVPAPSIPVMAGAASPSSPGLSAENVGALARAANRYFYLGPELALVRLNCGHLLYVDPMDEHVSANIIVHGYWEAWVHRVVLGLLRPGSRVVEVGANLGYYTVTMAGAVGASGSITALEANPRLAGMVERSLNLNGFAQRSKVVPKAALDQPGAIDFVVSRSNSGGGFVTLWDHMPYEDGQVLKIEAVRIDDLDPGRVDMIRIDAEGSEAFILRGAEATLKANPEIVICMEWSVIQIESRTSVPEFVAWLETLGFKFWRIEFDSSLSPLSGKELSVHPNCDIVVSRRTPKMN